MNISPSQSESPTQIETNEAEIRARAAVQHGHPLTQHMLTGKLPMYPSLMEIDPQVFNNAYDLSNAAAMAAAAAIASGTASPEQVIMFNHIQFIFIHLLVIIYKINKHIFSLIIIRYA